LFADKVLNSFFKAGNVFPTSWQKEYPADTVDGAEELQVLFLLTCAICGRPKSYVKNLAGKAVRRKESPGDTYWRQSSALAGDWCLLIPAVYDRSMPFSKTIPLPF
jgi:hypothetical protein